MDAFLIAISYIFHLPKTEYGINIIKYDSQNGKNHVQCIRNILAKIKNENKKLCIFRIHSSNYIENKQLENKLSHKINMANNEAKVIVVKGNRGVGKTTTYKHIIKENCKNHHIIEINYKNYTSNKRNIFYLLQKTLEQETLKNDSKQLFEFHNQLEKYIARLCDENGLVLFIDNYHERNGIDIEEFYNKFKEKRLLIIVTVSTGAAVTNDWGIRYDVVQFESVLKGNTRIELYEKNDQWIDYYNYKQHKEAITKFFKKLPHWLATPYVIKFFASILPNYREEIPKKIGQFSEIITEIQQNSTNQYTSPIHYDQLVEQFLQQILFQYIEEGHLHSEELNRLCILSILFKENASISKDIIFAIFSVNRERMREEEERMTNLVNKGYLNERGRLEETTYEMHDLYQKLFYTYLDKHKHNEKFKKDLQQIAKNIAKNINAGIAGAFLRHYPLAHVAYDLWKYMFDHQLGNFYHFIEFGNNLCYVLLKSQNSQQDLKKAYEIQQSVYEESEKRRENGTFFDDCHCGRNYNNCGNKNRKICFYKSSIFRNLYSKVLLTQASKLKNCDNWRAEFNEANDILNETQNMILPNIENENLRTEREGVINYTQFLLNYKWGMKEEYDSCLLNQAKKQINKCAEKDFKTLSHMIDNKDIAKLKQMFNDYKLDDNGRDLFIDLRNRAENREKFLQDAISYLIVLYMETYVEFLMIERASNQSNEKSSLKSKIQFVYDLIADRGIFREQFDDQRVCECAIIYSEISRSTGDFVSSFCALLETLRIKKERMMNPTLPGRFSIFICINSALILLIHSLIQEENINTFKDKMHKAISDDKVLHNRIERLLPEIATALQTKDVEELKKLLTAIMEQSKEEIKNLFSNYYLRDDYWTNDELNIENIQTYLNLNITI